MRILVAILIMLVGQGLKAETRCVAHRGNHQSNTIENTFASLYGAYNLGAHAIEFDVMQTRDGIAVINHDKSLARVAKDNGHCPMNTPLSQLTFNQVHDDCQLKDGSHVNTLEEILDFFSSRDVILFIELKSSLSAQNFELIQKYYQDRPENLRILSFKKSYLKPVSTYAKKNNFWERVKTIRISRALPFVFGVDGIDVSTKAMGSLYLAKAIGKETSVYTVNDEYNMRKAKRMGVDFITTDNPELCLDVISY